MKQMNQTVEFVDLTQEPFDLTTIALRIPGELIEKLRMISFIEGLSPSGWLEKIVRDYALYEFKTENGVCK